MGDENQARHVLAEMQVRISRSPLEVFGVTEAAEPDRVHAAFLELAKTYHPQKFARMAPDIQRLANEVFLSLRAAHDALAKPKSRVSSPLLNNKTPSPEPVRPTPTARPSSTPPGNIPPPPSAAAIDPPTARGVGIPKPQAKPNQPPPPTAAINPPTQPLPRTGTSPLPAVKRATPPSGVAVASTSPLPAVKRATPPGGVPVASASGPRPAIAPSTPPAKPEPELVVVYEQLERNQWKPARDTLNALIAHSKSLGVEPKPRYLALLKYSEAREAQVAGDIRGASIDLEAALKIDKDLQVAKTALAELFTRRK